MSVLIESYIKYELGEKAEPLGDGYYIIQSDEAYRFGGDAVAIAHFAEKRITHTDRVLDLCSGCGIIGVMINISTHACVDGVELDETLFDMSERSVRMNKLDGVRFMLSDARKLDAEMCGCYDAVVCNPPYYKRNSKPAKISPSASSEISISLGDVVKSAAYALKFGGTLYLVHIQSRLDEVMCICRDNGLTPKELIINKNGKTFMLRAVRGGKDGLSVEIKEF